MRFNASKVSGPLSISISPIKLSPGSNYLCWFTAKCFVGGLSLNILFDLERILRIATPDTNQKERADLELNFPTDALLLKVE